MADILASVSVVLGAEISGFRAAMADARKELRGLVQFSEGLKDIGSSLTQYVSAPLALLGGASVAASAKLESLKNGLAAIAQQDLAKQGVTGLQAMRQAATDAGERVQALSVIAKAPGLGLETAEQADIRLRAVGTSAQQSAKEIKAFANAIATTGGGRTQFETVTTQLSQLTAKGKVLAQDLRPIIEAAPAVAAALQRLYGTVDSETISASLAKQGKNSADFVATLTDELAKLPQVTGGLKAIYENDLDALLVTGAKFGDGIAEAFNLREVGQRFGDFVTRIGDGFAGLSPAVKGLVVGLGTIAVAVGPVLVAVGTLGAALPAITAGFSVLGVSSLAALTPLLPVVAGVAAAAYLVIDNWAAVSAYFRSSEVTGLFTDLATAANSVASAVGEAFSTLRANLGGSLGEMASAATFMRDAFRQMAVTTTGVLNILAGAIKGINGLLTGDTFSALEGAKQAFFGLIDPLANLLGYTVRVQEANPILVLSRHATEFNAVFPQLRANLDALNSVQLGTLASQAGEAAKQIGLLKKLEDELKAAKDAKPDLTTEAEIAASNQLIESLEAQIKRLNALGVASKEMQKAYADVQKSLRTVANESLALGDQYDYLKNRQSATESGIKKLIAAGFSPASSAVQRLVADLRNLNNTLGDNSLLTARVPKGLEKAFETPEFKVENPELDLKLKGKNQFIQPPKVLPLDLTDLDLSAEGLAESYDRINQTMTAGQLVALDAARNFNAGLSDILIGGLNDIAVGVGEAIGNIIAGTAGLNDIGAALLGPIGDVAIQLGKLAIGVGIGIKGIQAALKSLNPVVAIAGGIALVALGTAVKGAAKSIASGSASGSVGAIATAPASTPRAFTPSVAPSATAKAEPATIIHQVQITANGRDLSGALSLEVDRLGRVKGVR